MPPLTTHTAPLTASQAAKLRRLLESRGFLFAPKPYTLYAASKNKLSITVYEKGPKAVIQGKETEDFVRFTLEPEILEEAKLGYEELHQPEMFSPHFGIDESGKGDFFGPLVIAGVYVDAEIARALLDAGVMDSKRIRSDAKIRNLAKLIRQTRGVSSTVVAIGPEKYNQLYVKIGNLNRLLAWGHARVVENLLETKPDCPRALSDQFGNPRSIESSLMKKGRSIKLDQRTKAESDVAVAAASIIARERFIGWLEKTGKAHGISFPRGASGAVKEAAKAIVEKDGAEKLREVAKVHFRTAAEVAPEVYGNRAASAKDGIRGRSQEPG